VLPCGLTRLQVRSLEQRELTPSDYMLLSILDQHAIDTKPVLRKEDLGKVLVSSPVTRRMHCSICLDSVEPWQRCAALRSCSHKFHRKCISKWLTDGRDTCPLCKTRAGVSK